MPDCNDNDKLQIIDNGEAIESEVTLKKEAGSDGSPSEPPLLLVFNFLISSLL